MSKKKIRVILDSHLGELFNISPMFFYWNDKKELSEFDLEFIYIGSSILHEDIIRELSFLEKNNFSFKKIQIVSKTLGVISKGINFLRFAAYIMLRKKPYLTLVPYDQKQIFYSLVSCRSEMIAAFSHTSGEEVYSSDFYKNKLLRKNKDIPLLIKNPLGKEYGKSLGYREFVVTGNYSSNTDFHKFLSKETNLTTEYCIFSLGKQDKMFLDSAWEAAHNDILQSMVDAGIKNTNIKLHPSQDMNDFEELIIRYEGKIDINFVYGNPIKACNSHRVFINVLTSAGHHALQLGKQVCNYAPIELRDQVKEFGNDPYPYSFTSASEITNKSDLKAWLQLSKKDKKLEINNKNMYLSLKDLCKMLSR
tara:strand:+ start:2302 stop:3393 length:1092 start_codon:yes stop_codon:yes gene_type:complete